jgi:hypothetical protein
LRSTVILVQFFHVKFYRGKYLHRIKPLDVENDQLRDFFGCLKDAEPETKLPAIGENETNIL